MAAAMGSTPTSASPEELLAQVEWVRRLAAALVGRDDADEVVQQTYLQALAKPPSGISNLRGWFTTVARNVARRRIRSDVRRAKHESIAAAPQQTPVPDPAELVVRAELHKKVVDAVLALDEPYRGTLLLRFFDDQSAEAIARAQAIPVETVRTRVKRGLALLRARLESSVDDNAARAVLFARLAQFAQSGAAPAAGSSATAAGTLAAGGVAMSLFAKCALTAAVVAAAAVVTWVARRDAPTGTTPAAATTAPKAAAAGAELASLPVTRTVAESAGPAPTSQPDATAPSSSATDAAVKPAPIVRGIVVDDLGRGVAGAQVWIVPDAVEEHHTAAEASRRAKSETSGSAEVAGAPRDETMRATTNPDGRFDGVELAGRAIWSVLAFHPEFGGGATAPLRVDALPATSEVTVTLVRAVQLHGTARDPVGRLLGGVKIWIMGRESQGSTFSSECDSGRDGESLGRWSGGPFYARHFEFVPRLDGFAPPTKALEVEVAPGQSDVEVNLVLQPSADVLVSGPIVDESGAACDLREMIDAFAVAIPDDRRRPDAPNVVALYALDAATLAPAIGEPFPDAPLRGRVDVAKCSYDVRLPPGFQGTLVLSIGRRVAGVAECRDVRSPPPLRVDPTLLDEAPATATIAVHLVDAATGESIAPTGADLSVKLLDRFSSWRQSRTAAHDPSVREFTIPLGRAMVVASRRGFTAGCPIVELARAGERREVTIALAKADASIRGRVVDESGKPMPGLSIRLYRPSASGFEPVTILAPETNELGAFQIGPLAPEEYLLVADPWEHEPIVQRVRAESSPTALELAATPAKRTELRWSTPSDRKNADVMWRIFDRDGVPVVDSWTAFTETSTQGGGHSACLPAGHYRAFIACQDCREVVAEFDVPASAPIEIRLERAH
jgi:RNA polymerase sigma-70 factor (ECF subfamily)